jgi:hypothetical protein
VAEIIYFVNPNDQTSVDIFLSRIDAQEAYGLRESIQLHVQPFTILYDQDNAPLEMSPMLDAFTFDMEHDRLIVYSIEPDVLIDAIIEMAMFMRGFNTVMGVADHWKVDVAIGAWRVVRRNIKQTLAIPEAATQIVVSLPSDVVAELNPVTFAGMVFLAGQIDTLLEFPLDASPRVVDLYHRLQRIINLVGFKIGLEDALTFNQRLMRSITHIETTLLSQINPSPFAAFIESDEFDLDGLGEED